MNRVAILENAFRIGYELETNNLWFCEFSLPLNDPKQGEVKLKRFIELYDHDKRIGMFIVNPKRTVRNENDQSITYYCDHVLSTLHSEILFRYHQYTNFSTQQVLQGLLDLQEEKHWKLGTVEITRYFHYAWENEDSLLNALFSIPKPFDESYLWTWDDTSYPFTLNLIRPDDEKVDTIRYRKNLKGIEKEEDPYEIVNRIYPLGYGEGVNQLGIEKVNGSKPYIEDIESINKYGIQKKVWADKRFEDAESLKANAQALLNQYKDPLVTVAVDCIDYELIDPYKITNYEPGKIVGVIDEDTNTNIDLRIMRISKSDIYGRPYDIQFELGNVRENIGTTFADLEKKQLVNDTYSQGSTNIDSYTFNDNADPDFPAVIEFPFPEDMINVNESKLRIKISKYRVPMRGMKAGGYYQKASVVQSKSTASGGGQTTSSGGGSSTTSGQANGFPATRIDLVSSGPFTALIEDYAEHNHTVTLDMADLDHYHTVSVEPHTHSVAAHTHNFEVTIPAIEVPDHTHEQIYGIHELDNTPTQLTVKIDGVAVPFDGVEGEIEITDYLRKDSDGKVTREYHTIEVQPNDLARINLILTNRFFVQSRIGGTY